MPKGSSHFIIACEQNLRNVSKIESALSAQLMQGDNAVPIYYILSIPYLQLREVSKWEMKK